MKIQYGIIGFVVGISAGLLMGIVEMKLLKQMQYETLIPFVIGFTVIASAFAGVLAGLKIGELK